MQIFSKSSYDYYIFKKRNVHSFLNFLYKSLIFISSLAVIFLILYLVVFLWNGSQLIISKEGYSNLFQSNWLAGSDAKYFGILGFIQGTIISSFYALIISIPLSMGISLFITQYISNHKVSESLKFVIELIAAIPSVLIGFWGIITLGPAVNDFHLIIVVPLLSGVYSLNIPFLSPIKITFPLNFNFKLISFLLSLHFTLNLPYFSPIYIGIPYLTKPLIKGSQLNVFVATLGLVIMITPIIVSITVAIMNQVPTIQKEAAFALGATPWEMSRMTVIPQSLRGFIGAATIGLGRALGETMAVTMLIGNGVGVFNSIFDGGATLTTIIVNEWGIDSGYPIDLSALLEIALVLMIISLIVNILARLLVRSTLSTGTGRMEF